MEVTCETIKDKIKLIKVIGSLDVKTSEQAQIDIFQHLATREKLIIDLSGCNYISSSGLRVLLLAAKKAKSLQVELVYAAAIPEVKDVLEMTGFINVLKFVSTLDEAIAKLV